jgi:hypothetical protein
MIRLKEVEQPVNTVNDVNSAVNNPVNKVAVNRNRNEYFREYMRKRRAAAKAK